MYRRWSAALLLLAACSHHGTTGAPDMAFVPAFAAHDKVDLLFMVDNSVGSVYGQALRMSVPLLVKALEQAAAAGHPGRITSAS